ncbi:MAG: saccharopine dehydrogenase family protein [Bacteroidota bacterium]|nr:saccharopine dehydrogenase family protein [Bacteroidota bacterium]
MKKIVIFGAGRSSTSLIEYLLSIAEEQNLLITLLDYNEELAKSKINNHKFGEAHFIDANNPNERLKFIKESQLVISMLPAHMHLGIVKDAIHEKVHVITPSYVTEEIRSLNADAQNNDVLILNEMGLDPGIDHMSAKKIIDEIEDNGGKLTGFESFTGGLVAPESDDNPWNYKFTWNPRNVVLAGQGGAAKFIQEGKYKYIPYNKLFRRTEIIEIEGYGKFEGYANRDSLRYRSVYGLNEIPTIYRGTLRKIGFCRAWNVFVQLGLTDDSYVIEGSENMTNRDFINSFLAYNPHDSVELKLRHYLGIEQDDYIWEKLVWLGLFEDKKIGLKNATPAQILQKILQDKWSLREEDKDMIVMWHKFNFSQKGVDKEIRSHMVYIGKDNKFTAMSDTVGLPLGIAAKLLLSGKIKNRGVKLPIEREIYLPVLSELEQLGITFEEKEVPPVFY